METIKEYKLRYLQWLRIQKGKSLSTETKMEVQKEIIKITNQLIEMKS